MQYVCDASPTDTWFQIETEGEAALESRLMNHAVEKYFRQAQEQAIRSYVPPPGRFIEQNIGLKTHVQRVMPRFLTLRDAEGNGLATAMLPPAGDDGAFRTIVVGFANSDPFPKHGDAIRKLGRHFGLTLDPTLCYPYPRR